MENKTEKKTVYTVQVNYKSGLKMVARFLSFTVRRSANGEIEHVKWEAIDADNNPLFIGINDIESIWTIGTEEIFVPVVPVAGEQQTTE